MWGREGKRERSGEGGKWWGGEGKEGRRVRGGGRDAEGRRVRGRGVEREDKGVGRGKEGR